MKTAGLAGFRAEQARAVVDPSSFFVCRYFLKAQLDRVHIRLTWPLHQVELPFLS
jgi:hypothetical protein